MTSVLCARETKSKMGGASSSRDGNTAFHFVHTIGTLFAAIGTYVIMGSRASVIHTG